MMTWHFAGFMEEFSDVHLVKNKYCVSAVMVKAAGVSDCVQGDGTNVLDQIIINNHDTKNWPEKGCECIYD